MERLFFLLSGEHPTLPFSEITSILEAEGYGYECKTSERLRQVFRLETDKNATKPIIARASMTRICCQELFNCSSTSVDIVEMLRRTSLDAVIHKNESFAVRVRRIGGVQTEVTSMELERKIGKTILEKASGTKVKLKTPKHSFLGVLTENRFVFGLKLAEAPNKTFSERRPRKRPFFSHPLLPLSLLDAWLT